MKRIILVIIALFINTVILAQLSAPDVEAVYGGRINAISVYEKNIDTSRIFISTESANSIFYADVHSNSTTPAFGRFFVMPGVDASAGYGSGIQHIAAHKNSEKILFIHEENLLSSHPSDSTVSTVYTGLGSLNNLLIHGDKLFFLEGGELHFGDLDTNASFIAGSGSPITGIPILNMATIAINPLDDSLYIFTEGISPNLYKFTDTFDSLTGSTSYNDISPSGLSASVTWMSFGIAPSGRLFIVGTDGLDKYVAYSDDENTWSSYATGLGGVSGKNIAFSGDSSSYRVYTAKGYNDNNGTNGNWYPFGFVGGDETHPNDGSVFVDPVNSSIVYMTTDQGIGASDDDGETIFEIDDGVEAVQVDDFDMLPNKNSAWLASKSGIRKVINYQSTPSWTNAIFPNGDGSPYYSAEMNQSDTNVVYVGNVRIYKSSDNGNSWLQVFSPENAPYNFNGIGTKALAIEVCDYDPQIVFAGFEIQDVDKGGLFYTTDAGTNWDQILLEASSVGQDVDVSDIEFNMEGSDTVAYVSVLYDLSAPQGRSIYRLVKSGSTWTPSQDMGPGGTSTGSTIVATIWDVEISAGGDTVYAAGTDAGINHPIAYYKPLDTSGLWTPFTTSGFPFSPGKEATAITIGVDTVYCAVDHEVYYYDLSSSAWTLGYSYPVGTRINVLYYDELLVGTDLGLYGHYAAGDISSLREDRAKFNADQYVLYQNYPNPFNPSTSIEFSIPEPGFVTLKIYNLLGEEISTLVNREMEANIYSVQFDASELSSGIYFYRLQSNNFLLTKKMILMK